MGPDTFKVRRKVNSDTTPKGMAQTPSRTLRRGSATLKPMACSSNICTATNRQAATMYFCSTA
ncbi:hypothetical protein D3C72_2087760 [compost metagenome]